MAGIAHRGHGLKSAVGRVLVAGVTIDGRVSARQREAIVVLLNLLDRYPHPRTLWHCSQFAPSWRL